MRERVSKNALRVSQPIPHGLKPAFLLTHGGTAEMDRGKCSLMIIIAVEPVDTRQDESGHAAICLRCMISPGTPYGDELRVDSFTFYC